MITDLEKLIPSKDVRKYIEETHSGFTPTEEATLIYLSRTIDYDSKIELLRNISKNINDENLKKEIEERTSLMNKVKNKFLQKEPDCFYKLAYYYNWDKSWIEYNEIFTTFESVKNYVEKEIQEDNWLEESPLKLKIEKWYIKDGKDEYIYGIFDLNFNLLKIRIANITELEDKKDFTYKYVEIPQPFRRGDLVKDITNNNVYIITYPLDEEDYKKDVERNKELKQKDDIDVSDIDLCVEKLDEGGFNEGHLYPPNAEFVDVKKEFENEEDFSLSKEAKDLLCNASLLLRGQNNLEVFGISFKDYLKTF